MKGLHPHVIIDHYDSKSNIGLGCPVLAWDFGQGFCVSNGGHCVELAHIANFGLCVPSFGTH